MAKWGYDSTDASDPTITLFQLLGGYIVTQIISTVAVLGLADLLADGPKSSGEMAVSTNSAPDSLYRLLRALLGFCVFNQLPDGRFESTPMGDLLRNEPGSLHAWAVMSGDEWFWRCWGNVRYSVKTGQPAIVHALGTDLFSYLQSHATPRETFHRAMTESSEQEGPAVAEAYDFTEFEYIADIGGGLGQLLCSTLLKNTDAKGLLFEQAQIATQARARLATTKFAARIEVRKGDFFAEIPAGPDLYLMKMILHDWSDEQCMEILRNCRAVIPRNGRLLVIELVAGDPNEPTPDKTSDIAMLVMTQGGRERTAQEYEKLFGQTGFHLDRIIPTSSRRSIIEAVPVW